MTTLTHQEKHLERLNMSFMIGAFVALFYVLYKDTDAIKGALIAGIIGVVVGFVGLTLYESHGKYIPGGYRQDY